MGDSLKILIIEDDLHTRNILQKILTRDPSLRFLHLEVLSAADGEEGLALFKEHACALVITDLLMPKVDGFKVVKSIRDDPRGKQIPLIITSAVYRDKNTLRKLEEEFHVVFLSKPFSPKTLATRVLSLLRPAKTGEASLPKEEPLHVEVPRPSVEPLLPAKSPGSQNVPKAKSRPFPVAVAPESKRGGEPHPDSTPAERVLFSGNLEETSLASLLIEAYESQRFGTLELSQGKVRKLCHIMSGHPIFVQSNLRSETLGQMLLRRGGITAEQNTQALALSNEQGIKYGEALIRLGLMTEGQVMDELVSQANLKIEACLRWSSGTYRFLEDPDIGTKVPRCTLDPVEVVLVGLKRHPNMEEAYARLAAKAEHTIMLLPRFEGYRNRIAAVFGTALVDGIRSGQTLAQLAQATKAPQDSVLLVDALLLTRLLELEEPALTPSVSLPQPAQDGFPLEKLAPPEASHSLFEERLPFPEDPGDENSSVVHLSQEQDAPLPRRENEEQVELALKLIQSTYLGLHDANHYTILGVMPKTDPTSIEVAYQIKRKQFDLGHFRNLDLGEHYGHLEEICATLDEAFSVLSDPRRRVEYDRALSVAPENRRASALRAESLCNKAEELIQREAFSEAAEVLAEATKLDEQAEFQAMHALALFNASGCRATAEVLAKVQQALANDPSDVTAHLVAAKIYRAEGHQDQALRELQQALALDPSSQETFAELEDILLEGGQVDTLEAEYRRVLHLLGSEDPHWSGQLWHRLTLLYRDRLSDPKSARLACESALRFSPKNRELKLVLTELNCRDPARWPEAVMGYRSLLRGDPGETGPLHRLFELHQGTGRKDAAFVAASAIVARGKAHAEESAFYEQHRPAFLKRASRPLEPSLWENLGHLDDDPGLATLFRMLTPVIQRLHPLRWEDMDLRIEDLRSEELLPEAFSSVLHYVAMELGLSPPAVAIKADLGLDIQAVGTEPPLLMVGADALTSDNRLELCFRLGKTLSLLVPGRLFAGWRPRRLLRAYLLSALLTAFPRLPNTDETGDIDRIHRELEGTPDLLVAIKGTVTSLHKRFQQLNLGDWQRGVQRTAERVGLLLSTDLVQASRILAAQDAEAERDLIDFALSETYGELRASLGLAVT